MNFSESTTPVTPTVQRELPPISSTHPQDIPQILTDFNRTLQENTKYHLGYPYNLAFDYSLLQTLIQYSINNLGDPFIESNYGVHSRRFEIAVLDWFAELWNISKDQYWGYITSCGTEGNLHGIYLGRENLPDAILYASTESHYSVFKAARMYRMQCEKIPTNPDGTIDISFLKERLEYNRGFGRPAIINANIGTTLKGAIDDVDAIIEALKTTGYPQTEFYIHCDGALVGVMLSLLSPSSPLNFQTHPIGSISVSGHKFIGSPIPCGVIITRLSHITALANNIDYINSRDATIMGSRNGHAPLYLWYTLVTKGIPGIKKDIEQCIANANYLKDRLLHHKVPNVLLNTHSNTVVFPAPHDPTLIRKWQLACSDGMCHIVVMPNIDKTHLDGFISEYIS